MRTVGLLGGMSFEGSATYYRLINEAVRARLGGLNSADTIMRSVNFDTIVAMQKSGRWDEAGAFLADAARGLEKAGAECVMICAVTMHLVAEEVERAIKTPAPELPDLGQTADLLDALRRRRGARDAEAAQEAAPVESGGEDAAEDASVRDPLPFPGTAPVTPLSSASQREEREAHSTDVDPAPQTPVVETPTEEPEAPQKQPLGPAPDRNRKGKGRASIPSWDDILFGTRSEDDPA